MCFALYVATAGRLPIVPWVEAARDFNTAELKVQDIAVVSVFTRPNVYYIGSDIRCGCGFRSINFPEGLLPEDFAPDEGAECQGNHEHLVDFLRHHLSGETTIELYGAWEGDCGEPVVSYQSIPIERILEPNFYFREGSHYTVDLGKTA